MKEVQSNFIVSVVKTLNLTNITILILNNIFSAFIFLRRKIIEFIEEVTENLTKF